MITPSLDAFRERASAYNLIPVVREILADLETPASAFIKVARGTESFLLESVEGGERIARYSFMGSEPMVTLKVQGRRARIVESGKPRDVELGEGEDGLLLLKQLLEQYRWGGGETLPPFAGGAVGFLAYDAVRDFERLPDTSEDDRHLPTYQFMLTQWLLIFDHVKHRIRVVCNAVVDGDPDAAYGAAVAKIEELVHLLRSPLPRMQGAANGRQIELESNFRKEKFEDAVRAAKEYIAAGDIFQVVLSQRFTANYTAEPFSIYRALRSINPSPYMFYLSFGDLKLIGSSPEILVTEHQGRVTLRPIAGTTHRGESEEEDQALERALLADEKECAEHIMLVDLGRNDIGRVCEYGSVKVDQLKVIERYSHVMHIVSNVVGKLAKGKDQYDLLRACFPAGTLSGAPKIRAMEIIEELEPTKRGPYGGAVGYFSYSGSMDCCIILRTLVLKGNTAYLQVGAGLVADSVPEKEYQETVFKGRALVKALELAEGGLE
ncbi:MAG TPA: anthranilate synthase component I [Armatimonadota bacterium]